MKIIDMNKFMEHCQYIETYITLMQTAEWIKSSKEFNSETNKENLKSLENILLHLASYENFFAEDDLDISYRGLYKRVGTYRITRKHGNHTVYADLMKIERKDLNDLLR